MQFTYFYEEMVLKKKNVVNVGTVLLAIRKKKKKNYSKFWEGDLQENL